jgi:hypothetical protein
MPIAHDNQTWLANLQGSRDQRDSALADLHDTLLRVLPAALASWLSPDKGHFEAFSGLYPAKDGRTFIHQELASHEPHSNCRVALDSVADCFQRDFFCAPKNF